MLPLWDMMAKAQNGQASDFIARQFALSQAQVQAAIDALLPAFSQALKTKAATDPYGLGAFMSGSAGNGYAKYFEDASRAFSPEGLAAGNAALAQIFGSNDLARAVADQAARASGIGGEIMKQMMPALAAMMTGGFFKQLMDRFGQPGANPFAAAQPAAPSTEAFAQAWDANPWAKAFADMWKAPAQPQSPTDNPLGRMFEQWTAAVPGAATAQPAENPFTKLLGQMFETGRQTQDEYRRATEALFAQFAKGGKRD